MQGKSQSICALWSRKPLKLYFLCVSPLMNLPFYESALMGNVMVVFQERLTLHLCLPRDLALRSLTLPCFSPALLDFPYSKD